MSVVTVLPDACNKHLKTNTTPTRRSLKSMESIYSVTPTSSKFSVLSRRKVSQKSSNRDRNPTLVPAVSEIKQRVMSARMLRIKQLQNQIGEAHHRIAELTAENRLLKSLHKRQDSALSKYESSNAELPQLLHSHSEELRMWQSRCRNLQRQNKEMQAKLKHKETLLLTITDQNKQLMQLSKDKSLQERAFLQDRVKQLEQRCMDKENEMKLLARRFQLESKAFKSNLHMEQQKYRDLVSKIEMSDMLLIHDNNRKSIKSKPFHNRSPLTNRLASKSAVTVASDKDHSAGASPSSSNTLPPCSNSNNVNSEKKNHENAKQNSQCVNGNVKKQLNSANNDDFEIDLSKNCIDQSNDSSEPVARVKNGMIRARQQQQVKAAPAAKTGTKLSPLHITSEATTTEKSIVSDGVKSDKKSICNDSELSDEDDDFQYSFSNHNGTKTTKSQNMIIHETNNNNSNNARKLLDHKMHINELEEKMKQNSLDDSKNNNNNKNTRNAHQCSSSYLPKTPNSSITTTTSSSDDLTLRNDELSHFSFDRGDTNNDLIEIQRELHENHLTRESILDEYCETVFDDDKSSHYSESAVARFRRIEFARGAASTNDEFSDVLLNGGGSFSKISTTKPTAAAKKSPYQVDDYSKSNGRAGKSTKLDATKKSQLLAVLKDIDGGHNGN